MRINIAHDIEKVGWRRVRQGPQVFSEDVLTCHRRPLRSRALVSCAFIRGLQRNRVKPLLATLKMTSQIVCWGEKNNRVSSEPEVKLSSLSSVQHPENLLDSLTRLLTGRWRRFLNSEQFLLNVNHLGYFSQYIFACLCCFLFFSVVLSGLWKGSIEIIPFFCGVSRCHSISCSHRHVVSTNLPFH